MIVVGSVFEEVSYVWDWERDSHLLISLTHCKYKFQHTLNLEMESYPTPAKWKLKNCKSKLNGKEKEIAYQLAACVTVYMLGPKMQEAALNPKQISPTKPKKAYLSQKL
ncbi:hypothetical protein Fmac_029636 [Flemingia macrophylla]|uniref:Uncharacterized protein n=1 Tax=Flemingia macrophylla TaxID=520843 RepID=A0ABD1LAV6_9FABA